uniref:Uncharacterized protein n=6 Tax=Aegilops tauschii subsp. strangulata TaxID=200361 RepID=A0A453B087_AEGTS
VSKKKHSTPDPDPQYPISAPTSSPPLPSPNPPWRGPAPQRRRRLRLWRRRGEGRPVPGVRGAAVELPVPGLLPPHLQPPLRAGPQAPHRLLRQAPPHRPRRARPVRRQPAPLRLQLAGGDEPGQGVGPQAARRLRLRLRGTPWRPAAAVALLPRQGRGAPGRPTRRPNLNFPWTMLLVSTGISARHTFLPVSAARSGRGASVAEAEKTGLSLDSFKTTVVKRDDKNIHVRLFVNSAKPC